MKPRSQFAKLVPVDPLTEPGQRTGTTKYDPEFCQVIRDLAQQGEFLETWACHIGVSIRTLYNWANTYPEFEEAMEIAFHLSASYWTKKAAKLESGPGNMPPSMMLEILRRRFPSLWGQNARASLDHFMTRNAPTEPTGAAQDAKSPGQVGDAAESEDKPTAHVSEAQRRRIEAILARNPDLKGEGEKEKDK